ncbi:YybH family protein [Nocardia sp. NPDC058666]|uniref:YybH family protein n=1 Tax=Nocardia sp. NPDC058666 TaxID=3346587 RepID=UPI003664EF48
MTRQYSGPMSGSRPTAGVAETDATATADIEALFRTLEQALVAKDAAAFDQAFTDDVVFITPSGAIFRGWEELHSYHRERLGSAPDARAHFELLVVRFLTPDHAVVNVEQTLRTPEFSVTNRGTWVLVRRDGSWWVCSVHNTNVAGSIG